MYIFTKINILKKKQTIHTYRYYKHVTVDSTAEFKQLCYIFYRSAEKSYRSTESSAVQFECVNLFDDNQSMIILTIQVIKSRRNFYLNRFLPVERIYR